MIIEHDNADVFATLVLQSIVKSSHMITVNQLRSFTKHFNRFRLISFRGEKI